MGNKTINQQFRPENQKTTFQPDPRAADTIKPYQRESHEILKHIKQRSHKTANIITESLANPKDAENSDVGTMLDENNIL